MFSVLFFGVCLFFRVNVYGQTEIDADDPNIQYVGRVDFKDPKNPQFDWPGVYINAVFDGTTCAVRLKELGQNYYNVFVDGKLVNVFGGKRSQEVYRIEQVFKAGPHSIMVTKRTSTDFGKCKFSGFVLDTGKKLLPPQKRPDRRIEFIGDSITAGYGNEMMPGTSGNLADKENSYLAYGPVLSRYFNADYHLTAWSGMGAVRNFRDNKPVSAKPLPYYYENTLSRRHLNDWNFIWVPNAVVVYLGSNDFSTEPNPSKEQFEGGCYNFIKKIRTKYKEAEIFFVFDKKWTTIAEYFTNTVDKLNSEGDTKVHTAGLNISFDKQDRGGDGHPSIKGHQKIADNLIQIIGPVMKWE